MSQGLRIATDLRTAVPAVTSWQSSSTPPPPPPCFSEFTEFITCLNPSREDEINNCRVRYTKFKACMEHYYIRSGDDGDANQT